MNLALNEAKKAYELNEVPIGCVIVKDDKVISYGHNLRHSKNLSTAHAEILAINKACENLKTWRLDDCEMYVTLEPCPMCAGAILQSRISKVYFGARDFKGGSFGSNFNLNEVEGLNHYPYVEGGILEQECSDLITKFFKNIRNKKC